MRLPGRSVLVRLGRRLPPSVQRAVNAARGIDQPLLVPRPPGRVVAVLATSVTDALVGCGGTIRKHVAAGEPVRLVLLGDDAGAGPGGLGVATHHVDPGDVAALRAALRPADLVYAPVPIGAPPEHLAATRLLGEALPGLRRVALYEVWAPLTPNVVVDVTAEIEAKLLVLERGATRPGDVEAARGLAAYRSAHGLHGRGYAEAFLVLEPGPFRELLDRLARR